MEGNIDILVKELILKQQNAIYVMFQHGQQFNLPVICQSEESTDSHIA